MRHIRHEILDHRHRRQRINRNRPLDVVDGLCTGECVRAVDVHSARAANAFAARATERQRRIDLVFDLQQRVEHHRTATVEIDLVGVEMRIFAVVRAPPIDLERLGPFCPLRGRPCLAGLDLAVPRQSELDHDDGSDAEMVNGNVSLGLQPPVALVHGVHKIPATP